MLLGSPLLYTIIDHTSHPQSFITINSGLRRWGFPLLLQQMALVLHCRALLSDSFFPDGQSEHKSLCVFLPCDTFPFPLIYITVLLTVCIKAKPCRVASFKLISVKIHIPYKCVNILFGAETQISCFKWCKTQHLQLNMMTANSRHCLRRTESLVFVL